jgi:hypothetical protein
MMSQDEEKVGIIQFYVGFVLTPVDRPVYDRHGFRFPIHILEI